ncbi:F-box protein [Sphaceloma murrayae]|uniref:F-box protein n=1 Tax=Sphaceloma murrayae TaxID=2082308 RepID=A0A2K1QX91_9PEZI|nr:F-box protein [Sphaceloma murrayae]
MARRTVSLYEAYAAAPHGWTLDRGKKSHDKSKAKDATDGLEESAVTEVPSRPAFKRARTTSSAGQGPVREYQHLPDEILLQIIHHLHPETSKFSDYSLPEKQRDLHAFSLVNRQWNNIATPVLYYRPYLEGARYDLFTRTLCPSINLNVRKSNVAPYVRDLNLSLLVHQGSKSVTARLLGRTKGTLTSFTAPQASFSLNCFPALSKCQNLESLDLSLVSEASLLKTLFDTISNLSSLQELDLPRSAGFGSAIDPSQISWPRNLKRLGLSGGLASSFWTGQFHFPDSLVNLSITHCPKLSEADLYPFLETLSQEFYFTMTEMTFAHLPMLGSDALDEVLRYLPGLRVLSISIDYVTPELFNPHGVLAKSKGSAYLSDGEEYFSGSEWESDSPSPSQRGDEGGDDASPTISEHSRDHYSRRKNPKLRSFLKLESLELTESGERDPQGKIEAIDVLIAADDQGMLPRLTQVHAARAMGWDADDVQPDAAALHSWLMGNAERRGKLQCETKDFGLTLSHLW